MELKKGLFFGSLAVAMLAMTSCSQDEAIQPTVSHEAAFSTSIRPVQTRIDAWSGSEQVGVYMVSDSESFTSNVAYDVTASGDLTAAVSGFSYPASGNVAFRAYYPYASSNGSTVAIDLTDANTADHDLIFAETDTIYNAATTDKVPLTFRHQLAKLSLKMAQTKITDTTPVITYKVNGLSEASFDVATGTVTNGTATAAMTPNSNGDIIVLPGKSVSSVIITIDGQQYTWDASDVTFTKNKQSKYALSIGDGNTATATLIASIEDWTQDDGQGDVDPKPEESVIGKIRDMYTDANVVIAEDMVVTASVVYIDGSNVHVSDGVKGIDLYDYNLKNLNLAIGDEVTFNANGATLTAYNGLVELKSTTGGWTMSEQVTKTGNTKVLSPVEINASELADYMSMYVTIKSASAATDNTATYFDKTVKMTSPTGDFVIYAKNISTLPVTTKIGDISGVSGFFNAAQLMPTSKSDVASIAGTELQASATPTSVEAAGGESTISITTEASWTATMSDNTAGASLDVTSGTGAGTVKVTFPENTETTAKSVKVTISATDAVDVVLTINQVAKSDGSAINFDNSDFTSNVTVDANLFTNGTNISINQTLNGMSGDYVKFSTSKAKGFADLIVPAGKTRMRLLFIPWSGEGPGVVVGDKGTVQLYTGDSTSNACGSGSDVVNMSSFTAVEGETMLTCNVTAGETIHIAPTESTPVADARFIIFGIQFK